MKSVESEGKILFEYDDKKRLKTVRLSNLSPNDTSIITPFISGLLNTLIELNRTSKRLSTVLIVLTAMLTVLTMLQSISVLG
jgi:hypothetical protein